MKVSKKVQEAMKALRLDTLHKHQIRPINSVLDGHDTLVVAPTGSGKSAIFQVPAIVGAAKGKWTLVFEPTVSLIADQVNRLQDFGIAAEMLTGRNRKRHDTILKQLRQSKLAMLYITPERLQSHSFLEAVKKNPPWFVVVDEAHCVLDWGYTFRSDYLEIKNFIQKLEKRPVITALTATAPPEYRKQVCKLLGMKKPETYVNSLERNNIILLKEDCSRDSIKRRLTRVKGNIKKYGIGGRVVVYCSTRKNVDVVCNYLSKEFPGEVVKCHGYMDSDKRERHELQFISGAKRIMVATTAFGMGVDVPDIRLVIHFNLPLSVIDYYQQIGRAGRDRETSHAVLLYDRNDIALNKNILRKDDYPDELQNWLSDRLNELVSVAESDRCLMQQLLSALGEEHSSTCRHCTNCQKARRTVT